MVVAECRTYAMPINTPLRLLRDPFCPRGGTVGFEYSCVENELSDFGDEASFYVLLLAWVSDYQAAETRTNLSENATQHDAKYSSVEASSTNCS